MFWQCAMFYFHSISAITESSSCDLYVSVIGGLVGGVIGGLVGVIIILMVNVGILLFKRKQGNNYV